jgi:hypothetical protein
MARARAAMMFRVAHAPVPENRCGAAFLCPTARRAVNDVAGRIAVMQVIAGKRVSERRRKYRQYHHGKN